MGLFCRSTPFTAGVKNDKYSNSGVTIFPVNMVIRNGTLTVTEIFLCKELSLKIFDLRGKVLFNKIIRNSTSVSLITGVYIMQVTTGNKTYFKTISLLH
jgi:hypothetical protein